MRSTTRYGLAAAIPLALLLALLSPFSPGAAEAAKPPTGKRAVTTPAQGETEDADERGWALFGAAVRDLRAKYRDASPEYQEQRQIASEVFGDIRAVDLRQIKRISELAEQAARAGTMYMITPEFQRTFMGLNSWIPADLAGQMVADQIRDGRMTEDEGIKVLEDMRKRTVEVVEFFPDFNRLVDIGIEMAEEREGPACAQWSLEITYSTPPSNPGEPPHTYRSEGTWTLQADTGEYHAWLTDPEMSHWAFGFNLPPGPVAAGQKIEFRSIEQEGLFHDSIGAWEGSAIDARTMGGTFRYNMGGCCGNGPVSGNWEARCISPAQRENR